MGAAPPGTNQVFFSGPSSADANEAAIATAMSHYAARNNLDSVAGVCVVGFNNSNHGQTTGALSVSAADANPHGLPAFPWPKAEFP